MEGPAALPQTPNHHNSRTTLLLTATLLATDTLFLTARHLAHTTTGHAAPALWSIGLTFFKYLAWALVPIHRSLERSTSTPPNTGLFRRPPRHPRPSRYPCRHGPPPQTPPHRSHWPGPLRPAILPFCGLVPLYQGMAERFLYLPSIGLALALRYAAPTRNASLAALALFALFSALRLHARVADWTDPATLYASSLAATPRSPGLYFNLAFTAREHGDLDTAREDYQHAIDLQPRYQRAYASLGDVEARLQHPAQAVAAFRQALAFALAFAFALRLRVSCCHPERSEGPASAFAFVLASALAFAFALAGVPHS